MKGHFPHPKGQVCRYRQPILKYWGINMFTAFRMEDKEQVMTLPIPETGKLKPLPAGSTLYLPPARTVFALPKAACSGFSENSKTVSQ